MREKLPIVITVASVLAAITSALAMRDHVRLVEIVGLFASGAGAGAGITATVVGRTRTESRAQSLDERV